MRVVWRYFPPTIPVVGLHRVGDERLPVAGADRENREAVVVRELAEPVGEVVLPLPAQPRNAMRRDVADEAAGPRAAPEVLEAVRQAVGVGRVTARLELPEPTNRATPASPVSSSRCSRSPRKQGGTCSAMRASIPFRVDERIGVEPLDRRRGRQDGPLATQASPDLRTQVLVRLRLRCFVAAPLDELTRGAARERPESRTGGAAPPDA